MKKIDIRNDKSLGSTDYGTRSNMRQKKINNRKDSTIAKGYIVSVKISDILLN